MSWPKGLNTVRIEGFREVEKGLLKILVRQEYYSPRFLENLAAPDTLIQQASELYKDSHRTSAGRVSVMGRDFFLKRYNIRGVTHIFKGCLRPSRPIRVTRMALHLVAHGVHSPFPVAVMERRRFGVKLETYLLTEFIPSRRVRDVLANGVSARKENAIMVAVARLIASMHGAGVFHGDLKANNIIVQEDHGTFRPWIVDLDGARFKGKVSMEDRVEDLGRLLNSFVGTTTSFRLLRFFCCYALEAGIWAGREERRQVVMDMEKVAAIHRIRQYNKRLQHKRLLQG